MFAATKVFASALDRRGSGRDAATLTADLLRRLGDGSALNAAEQAAGGGLLRGTLSLTQVQQGFFLHRTDVVLLRDMTSRFPLSKSGVKILLKLQGGGSLRIGHLALPLAVGHGAQAAARGVVVTLKEPVQYEHRCRASSRERMLVITLTPDWLASVGLGHLNAAMHLSMTAWRPLPRAVCIAEQLLRMPAAGDPLRGLYQECRALELVTEALGQIGLPEASAAACEASELRPAEYRRAARLRDWLDSGGADALKMADISQRMGCNASTLQCQFRRAFGQSIFDYLRESRLRRAADAIAARDISMAQAAEIAGYHSQANFATAFRKRYGFSPKSLRVRL